MLVHEYIKCIIENTNIKNKSYFKFVFLRGLETITHVFHIILIYTKNIDVTYYNSQKALYFYIEFIGQIFNAQKSFLKLSSTDAVLYVYSKTIFEISQEHKKTIGKLSVEDKGKLDHVDQLYKVYKSIIHFIIDNNEFLLQNSKEKILELFNKWETSCSKFIETHDTIEKLADCYTLIQHISNPSHYSPSTTNVHGPSGSVEKISNISFIGLLEHISNRCLDRTNMNTTLDVFLAANASGRIEVS